MEIGKPGSKAWKYLAIAIGMGLGVTAAYFAARKETTDNSQNKKIIRLDDIVEEKPVTQEPVIQEPGIQEEKKEIIDITLGNHEILYKQDTLLYVVSGRYEPLITRPKTFEQIFEEYNDNPVQFARMDLDDNKETVKEWVKEGALNKRIKYLPAVIYIKGKKEEFRHLGHSSKLLERALQKYSLFPNQKASNRDPEVF